VNLLDGALDGVGGSIFGESGGGASDLLAGGFAAMNPISGAIGAATGALSGGPSNATSGGMGDQTVNIAAPSRGAFDGQSFGVPNIVLLGGFALLAVALFKK